MAYSTAGEIISRTAVLLGLGTVVSPYASADANIVQLRAMLSSAGADLVREHEWAHLRKEYQFSTVAGQDVYAMPADLARFVNQTEWNRTTRLPLGGPVTPQGWQLLKTLNVIASVQYFFRTNGSNLILMPPPPSANTLALEYISAAVVDTNDDGEGDSVEPYADDHVVLLDSQMLVHRLRRDFQETKGFDSTAASEAYERSLALAKGATEASPVLNLAHTPYDRARLLDGANIPPTGFGM